MENNGTVTLSLKEYNELYELKKLWEKGGCIFNSFLSYNAKYLYFDKDESLKKIAEEIKAMQDVIDHDEKRLVEYNDEINTLKSLIKKMGNDIENLSKELTKEQTLNGKLIFESKQKRKYWLF